MAEWIIEIKDGKFPIGKWTELVRCKDCKRYEPNGNKEHGNCSQHLTLAYETDYCSWGERKDEVEE